MRNAVLVILVVLLADVAPTAQSSGVDHAGVRLRLTGDPDYENPYGRVTTTGNMIRFTPWDGGQSVSILQQGKRATGLALSLEHGILEFVSDDDGEFSYVPLNSIATIERGRRRGSRAVAAGAGIATGVGVFMASFFGAFHCQPDEHVEGPCWRFFQTLMLAGPPVFGTLVGRHIRGTKWERITAEQLEKDLKAAARTKHSS